MIFKTKQELANYLGCYRQRVDSMIKRKEIKTLYMNDKKIGYVVVLDMIKYLVD